MEKRLKYDIPKKIIMLINNKLEKEDIDPKTYYFKEGEFASELRVSRSTIREAVRSLEVRGYVERVHGKGVKAINNSIQVASNSLNDMMMRNSSSFNDMIEVRRIIEVKAAGIAALRKEKRHLDKMEKCIKVMKDRRVSYQDYLDADFSFHNVMVAATKNNILIALVGSYELELKEEILLSTDPEYRPELTDSYHQKIYQCILKNDKAGAELAIKQHLDATQENMKILHKFKKSKIVNW